MNRILIPDEELNLWVPGVVVCDSCAAMMSLAGRSGHPRFPNAHHIVFDFDWFPQPGSNSLLVILVINSGITTMLAIALFATVNSMFADIADEHELETGERRERACDELGE